MSLINFGCEISQGVSWVDLNDSINFKVSGDSRGESTTQRRRLTAQSIIVEGTFTTHSVRDNTEEPFGIWVRGADQHEISTNLILLEDLFSQVSYQIRWTFDDTREIWDCFAADFSITRNQVFAHNTMALFSAQVPRLPGVTREEVI